MTIKSLKAQTIRLWQKANDCDVSYKQYLANLDKLSALMPLTRFSKFLDSLLAMES